MFYVARLSKELTGIFPRPANQSQPFVILVNNRNGRMALVRLDGRVGS